MESLYKRIERAQEAVTLSLCTFRNKGVDSFFLSFSPGTYQKFWIRTVEKNSRYKVHVLPSDMKMEEIFLPYIWDGYHVIKQQDKLSLLWNHIVLFFFVTFLPFSNVQKGHHRTVQMCHIMLCYNISEAAKSSKKRSVTSFLKYWSCQNAACIGKGKECHKTVLKYSGSVLLQQEIIGSIVVH